MEDVKQTENVLGEAISAFGASNQMIVCIEELSELQKELTKTLRGKINREHLIEEMADVEIMLEQLKIIFNINELELNEAKYNKIKRLKENIRERKNKEIARVLRAHKIKGVVAE